MKSLRTGRVSNPKPSQIPTVARRPVTAYDVARAAGVSQSAVSRAFSPGTSISKRTLLKVEKAARELGYRPNAIARMLSTSRSQLVGVVIPPLDNPFYPALLEALSAAFGRSGYRLLLFTSQSQQSFDPLLSEVLSSRVDALVMVAAAISSSFADECKQSGLPVVLLNRKTGSRNVSSVVGASRVGAETIAKFLRAGGHRRYAFIAGSESSTSRDREDAFKKYLAKHDLKLHARVDGNYSFEQTRIAMRQLLLMKQRPDAIFCVNDHTALSAINVAKVEFGLELGRELSIVGVDDSEMAGWPVFDLTTYGQPIAIMAEHVVEIIRMQLDGKSEPTEVVVPGELVVRGSARVPKWGVSGPAERRIWTPTR
jgi:DNA-binding LacI/PurR family transcriptional regulator